MAKVKKRYNQVPLGSCFLCSLWFSYFLVWFLWTNVILDCIYSWSLLSFLLCSCQAIGYLKSWNVTLLILCKSKNKGKDQESIHTVPHTTQDTVCECDKNTIKHHKQERQKVSPFPVGDHKAVPIRNSSFSLSAKHLFLHRTLFVNLFKPKWTNQEIHVLFHHGIKLYGRYMQRWLRTRLNILPTLLFAKMLRTTMTLWWRSKVHSRHHFV